jgi:hypothetical protein
MSAGNRPFAGLLGYTKETVMSSRAAIVGILALTALTLATDAALALPNTDRFEGWCNQSGGIFFAPSKAGAYGCAFENAALFCGGAFPGCSWHSF